MKTYILSGGKSSRVGEDKGLKLLNSQPMISYLIQTLKPITSELKIVANHPEYERFNLPIITDIFKEKGPLGGIYSALSNANDDAFILSVDSPFISEKSIRFLLQHHQKNMITVAISEGKVFPLFAVYPFKLKNEIEKKISEGKLKLLKFLEEKECNPVEVPLSSIEKLNLNTPNDFDLAEQILKHEN